MRARTVFVAFLAVRDGRHDAFLDWHELDHRPENHGAIEHIFHSERFVAAPQLLDQRQLADDGPFADPGQYLMTYWSTAEPGKMTHDMAVLREQLRALGRCAPINRDFVATWRQRMYLAEGYASPQHIVSAEGAYLTNHDRIVVTVGRYPQDAAWQQWYGGIGLRSLFDDPRVTSAYTLMPNFEEPNEPFVHLHYITDGAASTGDKHLQEAVGRLYESGARALPTVLFQGTFVAQHAGRPRFYE